MLFQALSTMFPQAGEQPLHLPLYPVDVCTRHPYTGHEIRMTAADVIASGDFQRSRLDSTNAHRPVTPP